MEFIVLYFQESVTRFAEYYSTGYTCPSLYITHMAGQSECFTPFHALYGMDHFCYLPELLYPSQ